LCTNFSALYDIARNIFNTKILNYNVDVEKGYSEKKAFIKMGKVLGKTTKESLNAYNIAKKAYKEKMRERYINQVKLLETSKKNKIIIVSHPYNTYDKLIGGSIVKHLKGLNIDVIYADIFEEEMIGNKYKSISKRVYWTYNKELLESIMNYYEKIDGIILLTSFPCGPDSLVNEMCIRKLNIPLTSIVIDELNGEAGLQTRIESFVDIINEKKVHNE
jgi:predicted nucleotide-binding protein (sugar kinase/HSP70/actin superfamily)